MTSSKATTGAAILSRALEARADAMPVEGARFILGLGIREEDQRRALDFFAKHQASSLTAEEREELESYVEADNVLSILRAQALGALKRAGQEP